MNPINKKKVIRKNKKWLTEEIRSILDYLEQEQNIEQPTAQIYYKKLIEKTGINATWNLIKWKVRHLRNNYRKAREWCFSNKTDQPDGDWESDTFKAEILRICPQYFQLDRIFGNNYEMQSLFETVDITEEISQPYSSPKTESVSSFHINEDKEEICNPQNYNSVDSAIKISDDDDVPKILPLEHLPGELLEKTKTCKRKPTSSAYTNGLPMQRPPYEKMKFDLEKQQYEDEVKLKMRKIDLEEMKLKADIEFKKKLLELRSREIVRDEKLKILEMEKDERVRRYEIEMKYKYEHETAM